MFAFNKLKISTKLITSIALSTVLVITLISIIIAQKVQQMAEDDAKVIVREAAYHYAHIVNAKLDHALDQARTIAHIFESFAYADDPSILFTRVEVNAILKYTIEHEEDFLGVYVIFEPNAFDGKDIEFIGEVGHDDSTGRFIPYWSRDEQGKVVLEPSVNYNVEGKGDYYLIPKKTGKESIMEPYIYPIRGKEFLITALVVPIFNKQNNFIGIVGVDIDLEKMQTLMDTLKLDEYTTAFNQFYSANGMVIKHRDASFIGKNVRELNADDPEFIAAVLGQSSVAMKRFSPLIKGVVRSFVANLPIGNTGQSWAVAVSIPEAELKHTAHVLNLQIAVIGSIATLVIILVVYWMARRISSALRNMVEVSQAITTGKLDNKITITSKDETGQLLLAFQVMQTQLQERFNGDQRMVKEINAVILTASQGDFSKRINLEDKIGTFKTIGESINNILELNQSAIKDLTRVFSSVAQGDLTQTITTDYSGELEQLKHDANSTVQKLTEILKVIKQTADVVSRAATDISEGNDNLSQRTTEQAASLEETASSMEEMTVTVQQNAENARQASQLAANAKERAEQGNHVVKDAIISISEIHKSSKKITEIISVINEIAFQTNLLALNAAVEAARAGEQGRGFAVVATEVRNLAQRSAAAAKEIKELIQDSNLKVEEGTRLANQSGQALEELVTAVKKVNDIISEIAAASSEQSMGIAQVNTAITQMDEMVEQNSALVEQSMAASQSMKEQAQMLKEQVAFFDMGNTSKIDSSAKIKPPTFISRSPKRKMRTSRHTSPPPAPSKNHIVQNSEDSEGWKDF